MKSHQRIDPGRCSRQEVRGPSPSGTRPLLAGPLAEPDHRLLEHVAGGMSDEAYLTRLSELRGQLAAVDDGSNAGVSAKLAVAWLRTLGETWHHANVPLAKADLIHAIYERIVVAGATFVTARLAPAAYAHGSALMLPQVVMASPAVSQAVASPAGFEPATFRLEGGCSVH